MSTPGTHTRSRAKKACKTCNSRRIRCNVVEEQPCSNCRSFGVACELIKSRRGKYERNASHRSKFRTKSEQPSGAFISHESNISKEKSDSDNRNSISYTGHPEIQHTPQYTLTPPSSTSPMNNFNASESTVFLGESSSISLVHTTRDSSTSDQPSPGTRTRLRYPIPDEVSSKTVATPFQRKRKEARIEYLTTQGAFSFPSEDICEVLLGAYFTWFHPCFPILDRHAFYTSYIAKTISPLLFQAVLFVGATHCNESIMTTLGYSDRQETRYTMYNNAKDIYDADYETDKITVSQAVFLMSFWRAGPLLEKDTRHWLGAAISLAQTKGMHRLSSASFSDGKLRKRIWWSLYVRDRQCSAALGLPTRIRDEDCDLEMLQVSDFEEDETSSYPTFLGKQKREHVLYAIEMAKLAVYLGKIVLREFTPMNLTKSDSERAKLKDSLIAWEAGLTPEMAATSTGDSFWASMLHLAYNNLFILLYRSAYIGAKEGSDQDVGNLALQAACKNTRIIEDVLSQDLVQHSNVQVTTSLFNSLCIHTICLQRSKDNIRKLAEYRAQLCLLGLRELQKTWDVTNWVLQLFFQFLDQSTAKKLQLTAETDDGALPQPSGIGTPRVVSHQNPDPTLSNIGMNEEMVRTPMGFGMDFGTELFGTKEAEDFSLFQLQPDLFSGDAFGGLDQYYNSVLTKGEGSSDATNQYQ